MKLRNMRDVMLTLADADGKTDDEERAVVRAMKAYFDEMYEIEREDEEFHKSGRVANAEAMMSYMRTSVDKKIEVHKRHWGNHAVYYEPSGMTSSPKHDWSRIESLKVLRTGDAADPQFLFLYNYPAAGAPVTLFLKCYVVREVSGELRIEHFFS